MTQKTLSRTATIVAILAIAVAALLAVLLLRSAPTAGPGSPVSAAKLADTSDGTNWPAFGQTYGEQHFSPLTAINAGNVGELGLAWALDLGAGNSVTAPLAIDGILYFASGYSVVQAVDATSGKRLWAYDPHVPEAAGRKLRQA